MTLHLYRNVRARSICGARPGAQQRTRRTQPHAQRNTESQVTLPLSLFLLFFHLKVILRLWIGVEIFHGT